jgi:protein involved in polysaccharide export with SLBB domain
MLHLLRLMCVLPVALLLSSPVAAAAPAAAEAETLPVVLGGGDELRVYVPGVALEGGELRTINAEGTLDLGHLGAITVAGLSLTEAERALRSHLERILRDASAATLTLHARGVIVEVRGLVARPGLQVLRGAADPWSALTAAGGALETADLERVSLRRGEQDIPVDVRRWLMGAGGGDTHGLPALQSGDSLFVPARPGFGGVRQGSEADVLVVGAVVRPGFVAHTLPLDLWQLIGQAGGPGREADLTAVRVIVDGSSTVVDVAGALASGAPLTLARGVGAMSVFVPGATSRASSTGRSHAAARGARPGGWTHRRW